MMTRWKVEVEARISLSQAVDRVMRRATCESLGKNDVSKESNILIFYTDKESDPTKNEQARGIEQFPKEAACFEIDIYGTSMN